MILELLLSAVLLYLAWGLFHHKRDKSLTLELFLEYLLIAALSIILLLGVTL